MNRNLLAPFLLSGRLAKTEPRHTAFARRLGCALAMVLIGAVPTALRAQTVTAHITAGSAPRSIGVNPVTNKMYVANQGSATVTVIDGATNSTTTVAVGSNPASVAVNPVTNRIYVANGGSNTVTVIDGATNATSTVAVGSTPSSLAVNAVTNKIYVANQNSANVTVIDGVSNSTATVAAGNKPSSVAVNPVTNKIYVANLYSNNLTVINGDGNSTATIPAGTLPGFVAVNPVTNKVYVADTGSDGVTIIDGSSNGVRTVQVGESPGSVAVNPVTNRIYIANSSGSVTVLDGASDSPTTFEVDNFPCSVAVDPVTNKIYVADLAGGDSVIDGTTNAVRVLADTGKSATAVAVNPVTHKVYLSNRDSNNVTVIDGATNGTTAISVGSGPSSAVVNPVTNEIYVANAGADSVSVVDGVTNAVTSVPAGSYPLSVAANPVTNKIYVANQKSNNVTVIDGATKATATVAAGTSPWAVAVNPVTNKIYVANQESNNVTVIDGSTNATTTVATGTGPLALAVNPVTNKIYVANLYGTGVTVIDGVSNATGTILSGLFPVSIALNPVTNKVYVANSGDGNVTVIDGATNAVATVATGSVPMSVAVNPMTNRIYVANQGERIELQPAINTRPADSLISNSVTVIDGATNSAATVATGTYPSSISINRVTNKIYVVNSDNSITVIDGPSNSTETVKTGATPGSIAINPITNKIYATNFFSNTVTVIDEHQVQSNPLTTTITPLADNQTNEPNPSFTFNTVSTTVAPPNTLFFQVDTWQNGWRTASGSNPTFTGSAAPLQPGFHVLYAYAGDGQEATSTQAGGPAIGAIQAYGFLVVPPLIPQTISFAPIPSQTLNRPLALAATASSGLPVSFSSSTASVCTILGSTAILASAGTCTVTASQGGNTIYAPATSVSQSFTVNNPNPVTANAIYTGLDTTTHGAWTGYYGTDGNLIANGSVNPPTYASISLTGAAANTWAASTQDSHALQTAKGSATRIASTFYSGTNFSINLDLTDGNTHQIALYLLDWYTSSMSETISVLDAGTQTVLNTQTFSSFYNGQYAVWNIRGNVRIQVTATGGSNAAVVAGIFFDPAFSFTIRRQTFSVRSYGGKCLDFGAPPQVTGAPVFIYDCNGTAAQQVRVVEPDTSATGGHNVLLFAGAKAIGVRGGAATAGAALELQEPNSSPGQKFQLDGDSIMLAANRSLVVEVQNNRGTNFTPLVLGVRQLQDAEFWTFSALDTSSPQPTSGFTLLPANTTSAQLKSAIDGANPGSVIVLDDGMDLIYSGSLPLTIKNGVTIRSDRRLTNLGARITVDGIIGNGDRGPVVFDATSAPGSRITGLRLIGPSSKTDTAGVWVVNGIFADDSSAIIIDHNEFSGWTDAAVKTSQKNVTNPPNLNAPLSLTPVQVVRNFMHHDEYDGLGYGVNSGSFPLVQGNTFLMNRHDVTGGGAPGTGYKAWDNLVLSPVPSYQRSVFVVREQDFDMHGTGSGAPEWEIWDPCHGDSHCGGGAGQYMDIERNTFLGTDHLNFDLRGTPSYEAFFANNVVRQSQSNAIQSITVPPVLVSNQFNAANPTGHLGVGDFDGDGKDDLFLATGEAWYYSSGGKVEWRFLRAATEPISVLLFGDFDGDGRTDVITKSGNNLMISWGGASNWESLNSTTAAISDLAVGDFDGDGRADIFYSDGHSWFVSSGGTGPFTFVNTSSFRVSDLAFGDLNHDGKTDVLGVVSGNCMVSYGATSGWTFVRSKLTDSASGLIIADFTGDGIPDIGLLQGNSLKISVSGTGNWVNRSSFSGLAAWGRFLSRAQAPDLLVWDSNYLDILPGGTQASTRYNPEEMR